MSEKEDYVNDDNILLNKKEFNQWEKFKRELELKEYELRVKEDKLNMMEKDYEYNLTELRKEFEQKERELNEKFKQEKLELTAQNESAGRNEDDCKKENNEYKQLNAQLITKNDKLTEKIDGLNNRNRELFSKNKELTENNDLIRAQVTTLTKQIADYDENFEKMKSDLEKKYEGSIDSVNKENIKLKNKNKKLTNENNTTQETLKQLNKTNINVIDEKEKLKISNKKLKAELKKLEEAQKSVVPCDEDQIKKWTNVINEKDAQIKKLTDENGQLTNEKSGNEITKKVMTDTIIDLTNTVKKNNAEIKILNDKIKHLENIKVDQLQTTTEEDVEKCYATLLKLQEENENLKEQNKNLEQENILVSNESTNIYNENKQLQEENERLKSPPQPSTLLSQTNTTWNTQSSVFFIESGYTSLETAEKIINRTTFCRNKVPEKRLNGGLFNTELAVEFLLRLYQIGAIGFIFLDKTSTVNLLIQHIRIMRDHSDPVWLLEGGMMTMMTDVSFLRRAEILRRLKSIKRLTNGLENTEENAKEILQKYYNGELLYVELFDAKINNIVVQTPANINNNIIVEYADGRTAELTEGEFDRIFAKYKKTNFELSPKASGVLSYIKEMYKSGVLNKILLN